ncbi:hypothetical protein FALCPG4_016034 [Fusarium falciforme]
MPLNFGTKLDKLLVFVLTIFSLVWPYLRGPEHALKSHFWRFIVKHVFGVDITHSKIWWLQLVAECVLIPRPPEIGDIVREIRVWWWCDGPADRPMASIRSAQNVLLYYITLAWAVVDLGSFLRTARFLAKPLLLQTVFWGTCYLFSGTSTTNLPEPIIHWALSDPTLAVPAYGFGAYVLALRGNHCALHTFVCVCWVLTAIWPFFSASEQWGLRVLIAAPLASVEFLVSLPYTLFWPFRHMAYAPLRRINHRCRSWGRRVKWRDPPCPKALRHSYCYRILLPGEIRLVEVQRLQGALHCRIHHVQLSDEHCYEAISYTWGSSQLARQVMVDWRWLPVTQSAYEILHSRAPWKGSRLLWIDSICIRQTNNAEKSTQIPMMGKIYSRATRVVVWLGSSPDAEAAFSLLRELDGRFREEREKDLYGSTVVRVVSKVAGTREERFSNFNHWDVRYEALGRFLGHDYFLRVWIIQEVCLGKIVHICCDGLWITWDQLAQPLGFDHGEALLLGADRMHAALKGDISALAQIMKISTMRKFEEWRRLDPSLGPGRRPLCTLLSEMGFTKATDKRDLIYGHLGLSADADVPEFAPDYEKETDDVYIDFATLFLRRNELPTTLYRAGIGCPRRLETLPSWVADWSCTPIITELETKTYEASKGTIPVIKPLSRRQISARGVYLDRITSTLTMPFEGLGSSPHIGPEGGKINSKSCLDLLVEADKMVSSLPEAYLTGQPREEAFWRTLIGDNMNERNQELRSRLISLGLPRYHPASDVRPASHEYGILYKGFREWLNLAVSVTETTRGTTRHEAAKGTPPHVKTTMRPLYRALAEAAMRPLSRALEEATKAIELDNRFTAAMTIASGRKFAVTKEGYMALVPQLAAAGDELCVMYGMKTPFAIRRQADSDGFELVGPCYVHGCMDGEALLRDGCDERDFVLI